MPGKSLKGHTVVMLQLVMYAIIYVLKIRSV